MKITPVSGDLLIKLGLGVVVLGGAAFLLWKAKNAAVAAVPYINPLDTRNLAYTGVNSVGGVLTGNKDFSLGSWIYDVTHPNEGEQIRSTQGLPQPATDHYDELGNFTGRY